MAGQLVITEEIAALVRAESARKAGKGRLTTMTAQQRREAARHAAQARWAKERERPDPPPTPPDPKGPHRDVQCAEAGIM